MILLDTHAAIWFNTDGGLGRRSRAAANEALAQDRLAISAISFWEIGLLIAKGRIKALVSAAELRCKLLMQV